MVSRQGSALERTCVGCGNEFTTTNPRKIRCRDHCNQERKSGRHVSRDAARVEHRVDFIGVDGEGVTHHTCDMPTRCPGGCRHDYVLLSVGDRSLHVSGAPLTFSQIMEFLWEQFEDSPEATFVGFFLSYDFTHWVRSLPFDRAQYLLSKTHIARRKRTGSGGNPIPFPVEYDGWEFDLHAGKRFKLRPRGDKRWMYICDAGAFFQTSFLSAIDPKRWPVPVCSPEEYAVIAEGKSRRADAGFDTDMIRYNVTENAVMSKLMSRLNEGFVAGAGVRLKRNQWYGPGQAAQQWMSSISAPSTEDIKAAIPEYAHQAGRKAYYGGWFEIFAHGHVGRAYEYDINSAYPHIIARLPCLLHGTWDRGTGPPDDPTRPYVLVRANVGGSDPKVGAMLHRLPSQRILRPRHSLGWYWLAEVRAAQRAGIIDAVDILEHVTYEPCKCLPPYRAIAQLYQQRLDVGKESPQGKGLKLVYNSTYGKMAQSVGSPTYACSIYASLITSGTRTQILDAIATHPRGTRDLLMVATDGVYFASPHHSLDSDAERLGAWDVKTKEALTLFMPGVYWDDKAREALAMGHAPALKARGVPSRDMATVIEQVDQQFTQRQGWPTARILLTFNMVTARLAVHRGAWDTCGQPSKVSERVINADPWTKRDISVPLAYIDGRAESSPYEWPPGVLLESSPYDRSFGYNDLDDEIGITPDGDIQSLIAEALHG